MANFIGLVYATLKANKINYKNMSTDEAIAKFNEISKDKASNKLTSNKEDTSKIKADNGVRDTKTMTRKELAQELYQTYLKTGITPMGRKEPLTEQEYLKRYLSGVGASKGFNKEALQNFVEKARQGIYFGVKIEDIRKAREGK